MLRTDSLRWQESRMTEKVMKVMFMTVKVVMIMIVIELEAR